MKTPEEIKDTLELCYTGTCDTLKHRCPYSYDGNCTDIVMSDALDYIEQLEERTSLNTLRDAIYEDAVAHGLWDDDEDYMPTDCVDFIRDEVIELEDIAMNWEDDVCNDNSAFCEELADVIIMCLSVAVYLGIDIDAAVRRKMEINRSIPWKNGKEEKK